METIREPTDAAVQRLQQERAMQDLHHEVQRARDGLDAANADAQHANDATCKARKRLREAIREHEAALPANRLQRGDTLRRLLRDGHEDHGTDKLRTILRRESLLLIDAWDRDTEIETRRVFVRELSADCALANSVLKTIFD